MPIQLTGVLMVITFFRKDTNRPVNKKTDINRFRVKNVQDGGFIAHPADRGFDGHHLLSEGYQSPCQ